ncbi:S-adenosylmethionine-dependent methyltransferase Rv2258c-like isoform X2 [Dreissena polymorpha]|uniref:S-adenosylmethionine-dependent methyltransferase Rv2258c-like isoform X2 n=1 Tax=Dreissena polymorpha TaxID=45954 RepID=UPI00226418F4|nr:S-adenosylmethionine-dependent methyltransferase Rv2258c-like isoform X2 [Dreissena polymorpha]
MDTSNGLVMVSVGLGYELGFFKILTAATEPFSAEELASKLNFKERYTREWLSCMVAAKIIHQNKETRLYTVPEEHKPALRMSTGFAPIIFNFGVRAERLKQCFQKDGPFGFDFDTEWFGWFNNYREGMAENNVTSEILPLWEKQSGLIEKLEKGIRVLDVGCGTGNFIKILAKKFPNSSFTGLDYCAGAIDMANKYKAEMGLQNLTLVQGDAHNLPKEFNDTFDMVFMYDTLHDLPRPHQALQEVYNVLKNDGFLSLIEVRARSDPVDNAGDMVVAMYYAASMFICLANSMTAEPHIGYGACWGVEEIQKAVEESKFKIVATIPSGPKVFFVCTK